MKPFFMSAVFAVGFGGAACGQSCAWPSEKTALEVIGLKNALMVAALSCQASDSYNAFVGKYQAVLMAQQGVMDRYFLRGYGLAGRQEEDDYMTRLANEQSADSLAKGASYCAGATLEFREVLGLPDGPTLAAFAAGDGVERLAAMADCTGTPPVGAGGTVIAAAAGKRPDEVVADAGKPPVEAKTVIAAHVRHKPVVKPPAKPVEGLVQV